MFTTKFTGTVFIASWRQFATPDYLGCGLCRIHNFDIWENHNGHPYSFCNWDIHRIYFHTDMVLVYNYGLDLLHIFWLFCFNLLYCITQQCIALHCIELHCTALHYSAPSTNISLTISGGSRKDISTLRGEPLVCDVLALVCPLGEE